MKVTTFPSTGMLQQYEAKWTFPWASWSHYGPSWCFSYPLQVNQLNWVLQTSTISAPSCVNLRVRACNREHHPWTLLPWAPRSRGGKGCVHNTAWGESVGSSGPEQGKGRLNLSANRAEEQERLLGVDSWAAIHKINTSLAWGRASSRQGGH